VSNESIIPTPATPDVCTLAILIGGQDISGEFQVLSLSVSRELNRIPAATIQIQDGEPSKSTFAVSNTANFIPGNDIEVQLGYRSKNETVFKGIIVRHGIKVRKNGNVLNVECRGSAVKMTSGSKSRYFVNRKDSAIMEELIDAHSLTKDVEATIPSLKEIVQYQSTDWDFLLCRAEANGQVVLIDDKKVTVARPVLSGSAVLQIEYGATVFELDAEIDVRWQSKGIKASSWSAADQAVIAADATEPSALSGGNLSAADLAKVLGGDVLDIRHGGQVQSPELQAWADARLLRERLAKVRGRAKCQGIAAVVPGKIVEITGIGDRFQGNMYISGVRHTVSNGNWETDVQFGLNPDLFAETYDLRSLPVSGLLPMVNGLQVGVVTALENDPAGEDRIRVRLPMISASEDGVWARLATLDAGKQRGTYFRPEIGDEVIVGHLYDDPSQPVIMGGCHSSAKPSPEAAKDDNHHKGYVSRSRLKLSFDDDKKIIGLETPAGNKFSMSEDAKGITLEDQNGNKITMNDDGIKIESMKDLILKAGKDVKLSGTNTEFSAQSAFKATGTGSAEVSSASTTIKGSATTVIQGGMVQIN